jgi:hypothetical protein
MTEQERPSDEELKQGWDSHHLRKHLNQMCEAADLPDEIEFVIAPTKAFAVLLTQLCGGRVRAVVAVEESGSEQYVEYKPNGEYFGTYTPSDLPDDHTVDLRLTGGDDA